MGALPPQQQGLGHFWKYVRVNRAFLGFVEFSIVRAKDISGQGDEH
jgi:hypothetical protein